MLVGLPDELEVDADGTEVARPLPSASGAVAVSDNFRYLLTCH